MSPFDVEADEADDITQQFWGSSRGWVSRRRSVVDDAPVAGHADDGWSDDSTGSLQVIREGVRAFRPRRTVRSNGQVARTRRHGVTAHESAVPPARPERHEASLGELAAGRHDDLDVPSVAGQPTHPTIEHEAGLVPLSPSPSSAGVDPLLARVGILILVGLLLVPIALVMRSGSEPTSADILTAGEVPAVMALDPAATAGRSSAPATSPSLPVEELASAPQAAPEAASTATADPSDGSGSATSQASGDQASTVPAEVGDEVQVAASSGAGVATVSAAAERIVPDCPATYVAGPGDSWYRIADAAGVTPNAVLDENLATVDTVIIPGDDICLPAGATMPTQPTISPVEPAPASTTAPTTTAPATTAPTSNAPAATEPPPAPASSAEVQQIIRDVWPDELEEKALQIAWRESGYRPDAYNGWCCYGVFQIYWSVHVSWLDEYGINSSSDLLDARKNVTAAYALYQRSGGWGPWGG